MTKVTRDDIRKYIIKIQLNFENAYNYETDIEHNLLLECWMDILGKYPKEICDAAVNNALAHAKFAPRLGDIVEEIEILINADSKTDEELWAELMSVKYIVWDTSKYLRYPQHQEMANKKLREIYNNLSEELKLYVVNISALIDVCDLTEEDLPYEKNRFFKNMPILRKHKKNKILANEFLNMIEQKEQKLLSTKNTDED